MTAGDTKANALDLQGLDFGNVAHRGAKANAMTYVIVVLRYGYAHPLRVFLRPAPTPKQQDEGYGAKQLFMTAYPFVISQTEIITAKPIMTWTR